MQQHRDARCHQVFFFLQGKAPKEIHAILTETLGEHAPSYTTVKNWVTQFKHSDFSTCLAPRPGRHKTVATTEIIDQLHELILEDRRISAKSTAEHVNGLGPSFMKSGHKEALREIVYILAVIHSTYALCRNRAGFVCVKWVVHILPTVL